MRRIVINTVVALTLILTLSLTACSSGSKAPDYPKSPVTMLVGFAAGGPGDIISRALAEAAKPHFPQPFAVVNKVGGSQVVMIDEMMKSKPDGYTIGSIYSSAVALAPYFQKDLPFKSLDDMALVTAISESAMIFFVSADAPWKTLGDFIAYAKSNPGKIRVGISGLYTSPHLFAADLANAAKVEFTYVPFTGAAETASAVMGGHVEAGLNNTTGAYSLHRGGKIRTLAIYWNDRVKQYSEVPTFKEAGYNIITGGSLLFAAAPKATPKNILDTLNSSLTKALKSDSFQKFAADNAMDVQYMGPAETKKYLEEEYKAYGSVIGRIK